jgi:predicted ATP-grasp superfamily ATP-dependent carboligase
VYFFARDGQIEALAEVAILRTDRLDGTGLAVSGMTIKSTPDLTRYCQKLAARLNYRGAGCAQFLVDSSDGTVSFLELNPRLGANFAVVYRAGLDLPAMQLSLNREKPGVAGLHEQRCKNGVRYAWATGDLIGLKNAIVERQAGPGTIVTWFFAMIRSNLTSSVHITWDWRDPLPTLVLLGSSFFSFLTRFRPQSASSDSEDHSEHRNL